MTESEIFESLKKYQWIQLWRSLSVQKNYSTLELATRAFLSAAWWQENDLANELLSRLPNQEVINSPSLIFLKTLTQMSLGDGKEVIANISHLKKLHAPSWQINWLTLEYLGRTANYKEQAIFFAMVLEKQTSDENYPIIACLQSLESPNANVNYIRKIIARRRTQATMEKVLAVRVGFYIDNEAEAVLKSIKISENSYAPALYRLGFIQKKQGKVTEAIKTWDILNKIGQIDKPLIIAWLSLSLSNIDTWHETPERVSIAESIVPINLRTSGQFASYLLIYYWINGRYAEVYNLVKKYYEFLKMEDSFDDRLQRIFFRYVLLLATSWQSNKAQYQYEDDLQQLYVIGESHSLSVSNMIIDWLGNQVRANTRFVMGVKMFHLAQTLPNHYKSCIESILNSIPSNSHLLVTIGEIDCRPDEGIWKIYNKNRKNIEELISETVAGYINWLEKRLTDKSFLSITIQGVPAPGYPLDNNILFDDKDRFLNMIHQVNRLIKDLTKLRGWNFLDVWSATANPDGISNSLWHIDGFHLKPAFYSDAAKWLKF